MGGNPENPASRHDRIGDELILWKTGERAASGDFDHPKNLILIHGFTSHGNYMSTLCQTFSNEGFQTFLFNYQSYRGIRTAANNLYALLNDINYLGDDVIKKHKPVFIAHSMGGLVARAFCMNPEYKHFMSGLVTLGTPHDGTLKDSRLLKYFIKWGECVTGGAYGYGGNKAVSAKELTGNDGDENHPPLLNLLQDQKGSLEHLKVLSMSGGKPYLEFKSSGGLLMKEGANRLFNMRIQSLLDRENDGLVEEKSADIVSALNLDSTSTEHIRNYPEHKDTNHSYLTYNQHVSTKIMRWLLEGKK